MKIVFLGFVLAIARIANADCIYGIHKLRTDEVSDLDGCHYFKCLEDGHLAAVEFSEKYPFRKDCDVCRAHRMRTFDGIHYDVEESGCPVVLIQDLKPVNEGSTVNANTPWHKTMLYAIGVNFKPCLKQSSTDMACLRQTRFKDGPHTIDIDHVDQVTMWMGDKLNVVIKASELDYAVTLPKKYRRHDGSPPLLLWRKDIDGEPCAMIAGTMFSVLACTVSLHIWVREIHHGKFVGLCGLYNERSYDDLLGSDLVTYNKDDREEREKFKHSWKVTPECKRYEATNGNKWKGCERKQQYEEECLSLYSEAIQMKMDPAEVNDYKSRCVRNKCAVLDSDYEQDMETVNKMEAFTAKVAEETIPRN